MCSYQSSIIQNGLEWRKQYVFWVLLTDHVQNAFPSHSNGAAIVERNALFLSFSQHFLWTTILPCNFMKKMTQQFYFKSPLCYEGVAYLWSSRRDFSWHFLKTSPAFRMNKTRNMSEKLADFGSVNIEVLKVARLDLDLTWDQRVKTLSPFWLVV